MPWLSEELPGWDEMTEEQREEVRRDLAELGIEVDENDDDGYYE